MSDIDVLGFEFGKYFELNPFLLAAGFDAEECVEYRVTRQGLDSGLSKVSSTDCQSGGSRRLSVGEEPLSAAAGLGLTFVPWSLNLNLTSPFLGPYVNREIYGNSTRVTLLTLSWSFGDKRDRSPGGG